MPDQCLENYLTAIGSRLRGVPRRRRDEQIQEIRQHLEDLIADATSDGHDAHQAVHAAIDQFGQAHEIGDALRAAWYARRASLWPLNRLMVTSMSIAILGAFVSFLVVLDGQGYPRSLPRGGQSAGTLLIYALLFLVAGVAAAITRTWWSILVVPIAMLATWMLFDLHANPDPLGGWGLTYLHREGTSYNVLARVIIHALELIPALTGAFLGSAVGVWGMLDVSWFSGQWTRLRSSL